MITVAAHQFRRTLGSFWVIPATTAAGVGGQRRSTADLGGLIMVKIWSTNLGLSWGEWRCELTRLYRM